LFLDSLRSNRPHPTSPNLRESALKTLTNGKLKRRKKQEDHLTFTVGVIFAAYVICNLPASVVLLIDPHASKFTQVLEKHENKYFTNLNYVSGSLTMLYPCLALLYCEHFCLHLF
jgi:hypothetical protein